MDLGPSLGFEDVVYHIERGDLPGILEHPNADRYAGQRIFVVRGEDYVSLVPFVEDTLDRASDGHVARGPIGFLLPA